MLRIGDFARLGRVSTKALRVYDEEVLLRPACVDRSSGYRYYESEQLVRLSRIVQLRDLGFALAEIKPLLEDSQGLRRALDARKAALVRTIEAERERLARLDAFQNVLTKEMQEAKAARARAEESPFLLFHDGAAAEDRMDVEVCIPLTGAGEDLPDARTVEGADAAGAVVYRGPYNQTPSLFTKLAEWIDANGGACGGPLREIYHRFGASQIGYRLSKRFLTDDPKEYVTELAAPIAMR